MIHLDNRIEHLRVDYYLYQKGVDSVDFAYSSCYYLKLSKASMIVLKNQIMAMLHKL